MYEINIKNKRTWNGDGEYVGRPSPLGNPISIDSREKCIDEYAMLLKADISHKHQPTMKALEYLFEKFIDNKKLNLICWCAPKLCHAIFIKQVLLNKFHYGNWLIYDGIWFGDIGIRGL